MIDWVGGGGELADGELGPHNANVRGVSVAGPPTLSPSLRPIPPAPYYGCGINQMLY
jgi:hypothetical protein